MKKPKERKAPKPVWSFKPQRLNHADEYLGGLHEWGDLLLLHDDIAELLIALEKKSGKVRWKYRCQELKSDDILSGTLSLSDDHALFTLWGNEFAALVLFQKDGSRRTLRRFKERGASVLAGDRVIFVGQSQFTVLDLLSGDVLTESTGDYKAIPSGIMLSGDLLLGMHRELADNISTLSLLSMEPATGAILHKVSHPRGLNGLDLAALRKDFLLVRCIDESIALMDVRNGRLLSEKLGQVYSGGPEIVGSKGIWITRPEPPQDRWVTDLAIYDLESQQRQSSIRIPVPHSCDLGYNKDRLIVAGVGFSSYRLPALELEWAIYSRQLNYTSPLLGDESLYCMKERGGGPGTVLCYSYESLERASR